MRVNICVKKPGETEVYVYKHEKRRSEFLPVGLLISIDVNCKFHKILFHMIRYFHIPFLDLNKC